MSRALSRQPGVADASVNLVTGQTRVVFDPSLVRADQLVSAVRAIGYGAEVPSAETSAVAAQEALDEAHIREFHGLRNKAVVSCVVGAVAMVLSMPVMSGSGAHEQHVGTIDPLMLWGMERLTPLLQRVAPWLYDVPIGVLTWMLLALTVFVMTWAGRQFYTNGMRALVHRVPDMNSLVAVGTGAAFLYSLVATVWPGLFTAAGMAPDVYYEAVIIILALVLLGRTLEAHARRQTAGALRQLVALQPSSATVVAGEVEREVPVDQLVPGDVVLLRPGSRVPVDGEVLDGTTAIDESMLTGEPMPVSKQAGDRVMGGTMNTSGAIQLRVTAVGPDSTLAQIVRLMRDAQASRAPIQRLADRVSAVFVPVVIAIALVTVASWLLAGGEGASVRAFAAGVAVLIIACPCAMGLAVPTAVMVATGRTSQLGALIKGGEVLQRAAEVTTVVLDKTGTLTEGHPAVTAVVPVDAESRAESVLVRAAAVGRFSEHPLAAAIVEAAAHRRLAIPGATSFESEPGQGTAATVEGERVYVGSAAWLRAHGVDDPRLDDMGDRLAREGQTPVFVGVAAAGVALLGAVPHAGTNRVTSSRPWEMAPRTANGHGGRPVLAGVIGISDPIRESSAQSMSMLRRRGLELVMLTGDRRGTADAIATRLGIDRVIADVRPEGKVEAVRALQRDGRVVAMVGDGINDGPALAQADVGVAMGSGTDVALDAADIALLRGDLGALVSALHVARAALRTMKQNLFWAFIYNVIGIPIAAGVLYPAFGILLSPIVASAAMAFSSVSVVANSLRLRRVRG